MPANVAVKNTWPRTNHYDETGLGKITLWKDLAKDIDDPHKIAKDKAA